MAPDQVDWQSGEVVFWDLAFLDPGKPLADQMDGLKEDLAQVRYGRELVLDIGWYPEFSNDGMFVIRVVRENAWDDPLFVEEHRTVDVFLKSIPRAVVAAETAASRAR